MARSLCALFLLCAATASAEILPQFQLDTCAWMATDIVVVTEGATIDGQVEVLETWKGEHLPGDKLTIPELAAFASEESRVTAKWLGGDGPVAPKFVSGSRMVLFLGAGGVKESTAWIEGDTVFAFRQQTVPGDPELLALEASARMVRRKVAAILAIQRQFTERGADVARLLRGDDAIYVRRLVIAELAERGEEGLPGLRAILRDSAFSYEHAAAIVALGKAGGKDVGPELTEILRQQLAERDRAKTTAALHALTTMRYDGGRDVIRAVWNAWSGDTQIGRSCMFLLYPPQP